MNALPERRSCPGCDSTLTPFHVDGAPALYCLFCGGAWIDGDTLRTLAARDLAWEPFPDAGTTRRCLSCEITLDPGLLASTPVERCRLCGGTYLDHGELDELARRRVRLTANRPVHAHDDRRSDVTFRCPGCGNDVHPNDGTATGRGMACMNCAPSFDGTSTVLPPTRGVGLINGTGLGLTDSVLSDTLESAHEGFWVIQLLDHFLRDYDP